jgi:hypothetical protein
MFVIIMGIVIMSMSIMEQINKLATEGVYAYPEPS